MQRRTPSTDSHFLFPVQPLKSPFESRIYYMPLYVAEACYKYNNRKNKNVFGTFLKGCFTWTAVIHFFQLPGIRFSREWAF